MAKTAKRLVSKSRTQLIDCRPLLHIALFSTGTSPFSPEPRSPAQHRSDPIILWRGILGGRWTLFCGRECPGRYKLAFNFVRGRSCLHHRLTRPFIRYARPRGGDREKVNSSSSQFLHLFVHDVDTCRAMVCDGDGSASIGYEVRIAVAFVEGTPLQDDLHRGAGSGCGDLSIFQFERRET